jgi:hypothetical protein
MIIQGRDLSRRYPRSTGNDLFEWCKTGRLQPFRKGGDSFGRDPKSPKGWRRVFPTEEALRKYNSLCGKYSSFMDWLKSRRVPDEEVIKTDRNRLALSLRKSGHPIELPGIEQFKYNLFRRRQRETAEISRLFSEIKDLESELKPGNIWGDPRLILSDTIELLMDSFFRSEDIEKILSTTAVAPGSPEPAHEGENRRPGLPLQESAENEGAKAADNIQITVHVHHDLTH